VREAKPGAYVLVHAGFAIDILSEAHALGVLGRQVTAGQLADLAAPA
jgi:hydrogenase maturation factor